EPATDRCRVADYDHLQCLQPKMSLRGDEHVTCRNASHPVPVLVVPVVWQVIYDKRRQGTGDCSRGLEPNGKDAVEITRGESKLVLLDLGQTDALDLLDDLSSGGMRNVAGDGGGNDPWPALPSPVEVGTGSVGVTVHFTEVEVYPGREQTTKHRVHDHGREIIRMPSRYSQMPDAELGLRRIRFVDDVHGARTTGRLIGRRTSHRDVATPVAEHLSSELFDLTR